MLSPYETGNVYLSGYLKDFIRFIEDEDDDKNKKEEEKEDGEIYEVIESCQFS